MIVSRLFKPLQSKQLLLCAAILVGTVTAANATTLSASLSVSEQQFASTLANRQAWQQNRSTLQFSAEQGSGELKGAHFLNVQTLSIELDERKKTNKQRRARVYQFNYNTQQSRLILVDLDTRDMVKTQPIESIHLPLNDHEIATARTLVEQQPKLMDAVNQEQQSRGLPALIDLSSLDIKASIFEPNDQTHLCAQQRCALVSLFDHTRTVFVVEPLVNLQALSVTTLQSSF